MPPTLILRFGTFELDVDSGELRRGGMRVRLQPQPTRVLALLALRQGELVTRDELRRHLWDRGTFVDFERGLNYCLSQVRAALGDSATAPRFIETLPKRGYRFVAAVEVLKTPAVAAPVTEMRRPRGLLRVLAAACCLVLLLLGNGAQPAHGSAEAEWLHEQASQQSLTRPGLERRIALERQVLASAPDFRAAQMGIAEAYLELGERGELDPTHAFPAARGAAEAALSLGERGDERRVLGVVALAYDWDWEAARRELTRSLQLDPGSSAAHAAWARYLSVTGRHRQAALEAGRAAGLHPACGDAGEEGWCHYRARDYELAAAAFRRDLDSRATFTHDRLFAIYRRQGNQALAVSEAQQVIIHAGLPPSAAAALGAEPPAEAIRAFLRGTLRHIAGSPAAPPDRLATLRAALGDRQGAIDELERALRARSPSLPLALWDPDFDELRSDPGFQRIVRAVGVVLGD